MQKHNWKAQIINHVRTSKIYDMDESPHIDRSCNQIWEYNNEVKEKKKKGKTDSRHPNLSFPAKFSCQEKLSLAVKKTRFILLITLRKLSYLREQHIFILLLGKDRYGSIGVLSFVFSKRMKFIGQRMLSSNQLVNTQAQVQFQTQCFSFPFDNISNVYLNYLETYVIRS